MIFSDLFNSSKAKNLNPSKVQIGTQIQSPKLLQLQFKVQSELKFKISIHELQQQFKIPNQINSSIFESKSKSKPKTRSKS